jgi:hypothetical protein
MDSSDTTITKRLEIDRRQHGWRTVLYGFVKSRRRGSRREEEGEAIFVDWHHPWIFTMSVGIMLLSVADAFLTLQLIDMGMIEANPVMADFMGHSTMAFAASKMAMTGVGILALAYLAKAMFLQRFRTGAFLTIFFSAYLCLICYELYHYWELST